jgi:hypothetical protein
MISKMYFSIKIYDCIITLASLLLVHFSAIPKRSFKNPGQPQLAFRERLYFRLDVCEDITEELFAHSYLDTDDNSGS